MKNQIENSAKTEVLDDDYDEEEISWDNRSASSDAHQNLNKRNCGKVDSFDTESLNTGIDEQDDDGPPMIIKKKKP